MNYKDLNVISARTVDVHNDFGCQKFWLSQRTVTPIECRCSFPPPKPTKTCGSLSTE